MNLPTATRTGFSKLTDFEGRATRSEFWWFYLVVAGPTLVLGGIFADITSPLLWVLLPLVTSLLAFSAAIRRCNDSATARALSVPIYIAANIFAPINNVYDFTKNGHTGAVTVAGLSTIALIILLLAPSKKTEVVLGRSMTPTERENMRQQDPTLTDLLSDPMSTWVPQGYPDALFHDETTPHKNKSMSSKAQPARIMRIFGFDASVDTMAHLNTVVTLAKNNGWQETKPLTYDGQQHRWEGSRVINQTQATLCVLNQFVEERDPSKSGHILGVYLDEVVSEQP